MKSNQERSNECLPPKKREIPSCTLPSDSRPPPPPPPPPPSNGQRGESSPWLGSEGGGGGGGEHRSSAQSEGSHYKSLFSSSSSSSSSLRLVQALPTVYTSPLSQPTVGGTVHYSQLPPNLQFIASPYPAPYAGYISQMFSPPPPPPPLTSPSSAPQRPSASPQAPKLDQQRAQALRGAMPPPAADPAPHHVHKPPSARTLPSPPHHHHHHHPLPPHHALAHGTSQVVVQYGDAAPRKDEAHPAPRELHNGELERGQRFRASPDSAHPRSGSKSRDGDPFLSYEARHLVLPSDYAPHDPAGLRTPVMLIPNSHGDHQLAPPRASPEKTASSSPAEKGGVLLGKAVGRTPSSFVFPPPLSLNNLNAAAASALSPQTVIQTTHSATEHPSMGLPAAGIYPQPPVIEYIAGSNGGQHAPVGYHAGLQHLLIPGSQPLIIPVSGSAAAALDPASSHVTSSGQATKFPAALPCTYIAAATAALKREGTSAGAYHHHQQQPGPGAVVHAQLHLPVVPAPPPAAALPPSLPPYFVKGSIIQLADGELKHVEDLKTDDFIQSAEISGELKIDSSTVERIDASRTSADFAVVQFSVGEHRAQVSVEVLVEYPFFVFGQGWSSCCPDRTTQLLELPCTKLSVGDVCISLTLKNLNNGSLKKTQSLELAPPVLKPNRAACDAPQGFGGGSAKHGEWENGIGQRPGGRGSGEKNGHPLFGEREPVSKLQVAGRDAGKQSSVRKRRWSAPEGRKVEKTEEEPPLSFPKPSFIPQEVKVSIEGRSNNGK